MPLNPITGSPADDILIGTNHGDLMSGHRGHDYLSGMDGNDRLYGEAGFDALAGGIGNDREFGGDGGDDIFGDFGDDSLFGGAGKDTLSGAAGDDLMLGGLGNDEFIYIADNDTLYGGNGNDRLVTGVGPTGYTASFYGGSGDDYAHFSNTGGGSFDGADGSDVVRIDWYDTGSVPQDLMLDLRTGSGTATKGSLTLVLTGVETLNLFTGFPSGDDTVKSGSGNDAVYVGFGANHVWAGDGDDFVGYGVGLTNRLHGGHGEDVLELAGSDLNALIFDASGVSVADGTGSILTGFEVFIVRGRAFDDVITLGGNDDTAFGSFGADHLNGEAGNDRLRGNDGNDTIRGGDGVDLANGGKGADHLYGGRGDDRLDGSSGTDTLTGGAGADQFRFSARKSYDDSITDFVVGEDRIFVDVGLTGGAFTGTGPLDPADLAFGTVTGTHAQFLYIDDSGGIGRLLFDSDGTGSAAAIGICYLTGGPALTAADIEMFIL